MSSNILFSYLTGALIALALTACGAAKSDQVAEKAPPNNLVPVSAESSNKLDLKSEEITSRELVNELHVTGRIQAEVSKEIDVSPRFSGRVVSIDVALGQAVKTGTVLAKVDSAAVGEIQAELIEAQSKLEIAQAHEERERQVYEEQLQRPKELLAAQSNYEQLRVQLQLAETDFKRADDLFKEKIASEKDFLAAKARLEQAKVLAKESEAFLQREQRLFKNRALLRRDLQLAKAETARALQHVNTLKQRLIVIGVPESMINSVVKQGRITAFIPIMSPRDGVVTDQQVAVGEMIAPEKRMFTITDLSTVIVSADIPEVDVRHVRFGAPVDIKVAAFPEEKFEGTISFISERVNTTTRTVAIRASLPNPAHKLKTNMFAEIDLPGEAVSVLACPKSAMQERNGKKVVYVAASGGYEEHEIQTGKEFADFVEVVSGLKDGDRVATQGSLLLRTAMSTQQQQTKND